MIGNTHRTLKVIALLFYCYLYSVFFYFRRGNRKNDKLVAIFSRSSLEKGWRLRHGTWNYQTLLKVTVCKIKLGNTKTRKSGFSCFCIFDSENAEFSNFNKRYGYFVFPINLLLLESPEYTGGGRINGVCGGMERERKREREGERENLFISLLATWFTLCKYILYNPYVVEHKTRIIRRSHRWFYRLISRLKLKSSRFSPFWIQ